MSEPPKRPVEFSERRALRLIILGRESELLPRVAPGIDKEIAILKEMWRLFIDKNENDWRLAKIYSDRKELARFVNQNEMKMEYIMSRFTKECSSYKEYETKKCTSKHRLDSLLVQIKQYARTKINN